MCAHNVSVMPHGSVQCDLFFLFIVVYLNQLLALTKIINLLEPHGICLILFVSSTRGITFKVVVCFNAYTAIFIYCLVTSDNAQLQFPRFSCSFH